MNFFKSNLDNLFFTVVWKKRSVLNRISADFDDSFQNLAIKEHMFLDFVHDHTENVDFIYKGFAQEQLFSIVQESSEHNFKHFHRRR